MKVLFYIRKSKRKALRYTPLTLGCEYCFGYELIPFLLTLISDRVVYVSDDLLRHSLSVVTVVPALDGTVVVLELFGSGGDGGTRSN